MPSLLFYLVQNLTIFQLNTFPDQIPISQMPWHPQCHPRPHQAQVPYPSWLLYSQHRYTVLMISWFPGNRTQNLQTENFPGASSCTVWSRQLLRFDQKISKSNLDTFSGPGRKILCPCADSPVWKSKRPFCNEFLNRSAPVGPLCSG